MLPLSLLNTAQGNPMMVELKTGETYNGHLVNCDPWMNINLREVIRTSSDGQQFWRMPEIYIRGNTIKYVRVPDSVLEAVKDDQAKKAAEAAAARNDAASGSFASNRGGRGGRGGGRGGQGSWGNRPGSGRGGRGGRGSFSK